MAKTQDGVPASTQIINLNGGEEHPGMIRIPLIGGEVEWRTPKQQEELVAVLRANSEAEERRARSSGGW